MSTTSWTTQGCKLYFLNQSASPVVVATAAQIVGFTGLGGKRGKEDVTSMDSSGYKEYAPKLIDPGEVSIDLIWDFNNANHKLIQTLAQTAQFNLNAEFSKQIYPFFFGAADSTNAPTWDSVNKVLVPPVTASPKTYTRSGFLFSGYFSMFQVNAPVDGIIKVKTGIQTSGSIETIVFGASANASETI